MDVHIVRLPYSEESGPKITKEQKARFREALKGKLDPRTCRDCASSRGFVQVVEFLIEMNTEANMRMDKASQIMEEFIELFKEIELAEMKARFGDDGR